ncbi:MAG: ABC transporter ATP-binding protein [Nitrososphaerales archaeon]
MSLAELQNVKKYFGDVHAVDDVSLKINENEQISLIGPNGAGKTTLINIFAGTIKLNSGKIIFMGKDITHLPPYKRCELGLARSFQLPAIYPNLTVYDSVRASIISKLKKGKRFYSSVDLDDEVNKMTKEVLELFELYNKRDMLAIKLPHGDKKLLDVACAFALWPKLILLDEPTSGVSTIEKRKVMEKILSVSKEMGIKSFIIVEHDMDIVFSYSNRIIVMYEGKVLADGKPEKIKENAEVVRILLGKVK